MSVMKPPLVRERLRSEKEIVSEVMDRLEEQGFAPLGADPLKDGLVQIFARYCQILSERLNRVPESHRHDFISMLGATPAPAVPAQVPLSFKAVATAQTVTAVVPKFTQVSARAESGSEAVIFETLKDLRLVQAELKQAVAVEPKQLLRADVSGVVSAAGFTKAFLWADAVPLERAMHISQPAIIGLKKLNSLHLKVDLDQPTKLPPSFEIEWGIWSEAGFNVLRPESDTTNGLTRSGEVVFVPPHEWPGWTILHQTAPWLTCRLRPRASELLTTAEVQYSGTISRMEITAYTKATAVPPTRAFNGGIPLDLSRDFFPFGELPRFGEVFYILSENFALPGARVILDMKLTNPVGAIDSPIPAVSRKGNPRVRWETHTKGGWVPLNCIDGTHSLTQDGQIELVIPADAEPTAINVVVGGWVRARLVGGSYAADNVPESNRVFPQANPPSIATISLTSIKEFGPEEPERLVIESGLEYRDVDETQPFNPFPAPVEQEPMLYLGFAGCATALAGRTLSLYAIPWNEGKRMFCRDSNKSARADTALRWQAYTSTGWRDCNVTDSTQGLRNPGIIELQMPEDIAGWGNSTVDLNTRLVWVRIALGDAFSSSRPEGEQLPCLQRLLLNTIPARQTLRITDELLGSSNGRPKQIFHTLRKPVIGEVKLQVREPEGSADNVSELSGIRPDKESEDRFGVIKISRSVPNETWIAWSEVENFSSSDPRARHYVLDRLTGRVLFGDGKNGRVPPPGGNNIRLHEYHTGGGRGGNQPPETVTQLRTTIPYVESVTNPAPAAGGQDQESLGALGRNATAGVRHRDRAICADDYADLARKASPEIAYATCAAARDLLLPPESENEVKPGIVTVVVVPHSDERRPQPSYQLLKNVKAFLDSRRPVTVDLIVMGPEYIGINVVTDIVWNPDYSTADAAAECERRLNLFLHPVNGGLNGQGWEFGQLPHESDLYPLLGDIEGLDHIRNLELRHEEERPGLLSTRAFLICSGKHEIRIC